MKKLILLVALVCILSNVASAAVIISNVVRSGGVSGNRDWIGAYDGSTTPGIDDSLADGDYVFSDRTYTYAETPAELLGAEIIQTFNSDKSAEGVTYTVTLSVGCIYAIGYDDRFADQQAKVDAIAGGLPAGTFGDSGLDVFVGGDGDPPGRQLSVFTAQLPAGTYTFTGTGFGGQNNFMVMGAIPEPATLALLGFGGLAFLRRKR